MTETPEEALALHVQRARHIAILTGAGMSAESGVPTFRDALTGLWSKFRPEELATEAAFRARPAEVWDWYAERRAAVARVAPNAGHDAMAAFQHRHPGRATVITQNVDGLHQRAGSPGVLALHGDITVDQWLDPPQACCQPDTVTATRPPHCSRCGNLRRPAVVWFGEMLPMREFGLAQQAARACDLMIVVGTSGAVYPAAGLALTAREGGAQVALVNPHVSELDDAAHLIVRGTAATVLPRALAD